MKRRPFLKIASTIAGASTLGLAELIAAAREEMPYRPLGKTGMKISVSGYSGFALAHGTQEEGNKAIRNAIDLGVNYFDVAPAYLDSEEKMGIAMEGISRDKYYLACKTKMRDKDDARKELEQSLKRLKTDHFDVYQFHYIRNQDEVEQIFGPNGAMETFAKAKEEGKIRFIGFSSHTTKAAVSALKQYPFASILFPLSFVEYYKIGLGKEVLEEAEKAGTGVLAMKALCGGAWNNDEKRNHEWWYKTLNDPEEISLAMRFSLSLKGVAACFSPAFLDLNEKSIAAMRSSYKPVTKEELAMLEEKARKSISIFEKEEKGIAMGNLPDSHYACPEQCRDYFA